MNKTLTKKYNIGNIKDENVSKYIKNIDGMPKYLKEEKVIKFIEKLSDISIVEQIELIRKKNKKVL